MTDADHGHLYIVLISIHGLIRGEDLELGRDPDTGGQTLYVVELARALARHKDVWRVDLLTRQVVDPKVSDDYARPEEALADNAYIVRIPCGPRRYLRKEVLWPYLDTFTDSALQHVRRVGHVPDVIHSHYADAGYVGAGLASLLGVPLFHTGHSLGRVKRQRLREQGVKPETMERHYNLGQRIEAEETALDSASLVITSTHQEVEEQYSLYDNYQPRRMEVIPPGVDLSRFHPPRRGEAMRAPIWNQLRRFLTNPRRPMILALSRADERKNIQTLVRAYGEHPRLRELANLVIVAGNRDDIETMERGSRTVLNAVLLHIDRYDLYGSVAYPKHHDSTDVPDLYRLAAWSRGVFVNPALTEPFGLTLIEAAASGLPIVATADGGPRDIVGHCRNGLLIDPLDPVAMGNALERAITDRRQWRQWATNGVNGAHRHYAWASHVQKYMKALHRVWGKHHRHRRLRAKSRLPTVDRLVVCELDNTLLGDREGLQRLLERLQEGGARVGFGIATGRPVESTIKLLRDWQVPAPDLIIAAVGAAIHYGPSRVADRTWERHIDYRWKPDALREALRALPGLKLQPRGDQHRYKISYFMDEKKAPSVRHIVRHLRLQDLHANVIQSRGMFLDLLPCRASKGLALRYLGVKWGLRPEQLLVAGFSGNDEEVLRGNTLGVVVGNYSAELEPLRGRPRIYFADSPYAWGILEGIEHYDFLGTIRVPEEEGSDHDGDIARVPA